ncbi:MAG: hypothetical protein AAGM22_01685 [Acidobacteriota bacterium]
MPEDTPSLNTGSSNAESSDRRILYCHCAFSRVVDAKKKGEVLAGLASSGLAFDAVPDLCELAARQDPDLERLAASGCAVDIVACYPRAVRWLFHAAEVELPEDGVRIHNMRADEPEQILADLHDPDAGSADGAALENDTAQENAA